MVAIEEKNREVDASREIVATRLFGAPRALVFDAFTSREHVGHWWGPRGFTITTREMDVRPGGAWNFVMHGPDGTDYANKIVYREVVRPEFLAYSHVNGPYFDVTVTFEERGAQTAVTLRMTFATAAERENVVTRYGAVEGLHQTLDRLGEHLAGRDAFTISRTFDAPRELVFRAWTERDRLLRWWGPKGMSVAHCTNDLRPGGMMHYCLRSSDGAELWGKWIYREITPPRQLVFVTSFSDPQGGTIAGPFFADWPLEILSTITFDETDGKTTVTVQWAPIDATDAERAMFASQHASMNGGWGGTLEKLGEYVAEVSR